MSLRRNAIYLTVEKAVHTLGGLLCMVLVARILGTDALADYGFAISLTAFFIPFLDLGMNNRIIKSVAAGEDVSRTVEEVVAFKLASAPFVFVFMMIGGLLWGGAHVAGLVALIGVSTISMSLGDTANSVFKGLHRSHLSCWIITALNGVLLVSLFAALMTGGGLGMVGWCYALSRLAYGGSAFALLRRVRPDATFSVRVGFDLSTARDGFLHLPGIYYLGNLLSLSYLVTYVLSPQDAGGYYVGYRSAAATYILVSAGFEAVLASTVSGDSRSSGLGMWFVIYSLIALLLLYLAAPLVVSVFGSSFSESVRPIRLLASCVPAFALCGLAHTLLMAARHERFGAGTMAALLVGGFGMAIAFGALYGADATALAPAVSSSLAMVVLWIGLSRRIKRLTADGA